MPTDAFDVFASSSARSPPSHPAKGCEASVALTGPTVHDLVARIWAEAASRSATERQGSRQNASVNPSRSRIR